MATYPPWQKVYIIAVFGAFLTPGPGSGIMNPNPYFLELSDKFLGKKFFNSLKTGPNFFLHHFKNKFFQFCDIFGYKKGMTSNFFSPPLSFIEVFGSGIRDLGWVKNQDPGSGINIPDSQHCIIVSKLKFKFISGHRLRLGKLCEPTPLPRGYFSEEKGEIYLCNNNFSNVSKQNQKLGYNTGFPIRKSLFADL